MMKLYWIWKRLQDALKYLIFPDVGTRKNKEFIGEKFNKNLSLQEQRNKECKGSSF